MPDINLTESSEVTVADAAGVNKLAVNTDGSINNRGTTSSGTITITGAAQQFAISTVGYNEVFIHVTGTFSGTILPWLTVNGTQLIGPTPILNVSTGQMVTSITATGGYRFTCPETNNVQVTTSVWSSGTATIYWIAGQGSATKHTVSWLGSTAPSVGQKTMANSLPVVISSDQTSLPITVSTGVIKTTQVTYNTPTIGDQATAVVAGVSGKKIRVYSVAVSLGISSSNIYLRNGAGGTQLSVLFLRTTGGSVPSYYYQEATYGTFLFETSAGTALVCNSSTNVGPISIQVVYTEV